MMANRNTDKTYIKEIKAGQTGYGLLIERDGGLKCNPDVISQIKEDINHQDRFVIPDRFIVNAILQKYGIKNANGRIYPEDILKREVERYDRECVHGFGNTAIGACDHPSFSSLSLHDVSHKIINLEWRDHTLVGQLELHLSPGYRRYGVASTSGDLVANLILDGIQVGVSSRALGNVVQKLGALIVDDSLELIGWDVVATPSTPNAWITTEADKLEQFIENKEGDKTKQHINETLERAKNLVALW
jgi:hypothetical protein